MLPILQDKTVLTMSSRELSKLTDKRHDNTLKLISNLIDGGVLKNTTLSRYKNDQNGQLYPEYLCDKRDSLIIVARLSPEFTAAIVDRWQELEQQAAEPQFNIPKTLPEALRLAADLADQLAIAAPKVAVYELLADRKGDVSTTVVAKELGTTAAKLNLFLKAKGVKWLNADLPKAGYEAWFNVVTLDVNGGTRNQCLVTPKGQLKIAELWAKK